MKIAFVFAGHLRSFKENNSLVRNLIEPNGGDVFVHTFSKRNVRGLKWHNDEAWVDENVTDADLNWIQDNIPGVISIVRDVRTCGADALPDEHKKMGFRESWRLAHFTRRFHEQEENKKYDVVFNARWDLVLDEPLYLPYEIRPNTFYGSYNLTSIEKGIDGEVFAYGSPEVMNAMYAEAVPEQLASKVASFDYEGERLVTEVRKSLGIEYVTHRHPCYLLRSGGTLVRIRI